MALQQKTLWQNLPHSSSGPQAAVRGQARGWSSTHTPLGGRCWCSAPTPRWCQQVKRALICQPLPSTSRQPTLPSCQGGDGAITWVVLSHPLPGGSRPCGFPFQGGISGAQQQADPPRSSKEVAHGRVSCHFTHTHAGMHPPSAGPVTSGASTPTKHQ